ncbi:hypothetical protein CHGG_00316 [Chaetomium globosum CBS 148.51]|uniref:Peptidase C14 caspase domain-containing protein n=1 Tax=Chaetomium globosum (strain ATCC 6205 / CBS 148.51 / DSM 1962 / NBRC 6347 / NRRL 1970) TaxID=306901 RepID=Q2HHI8_CHAGB|nr:uncharacterized protein CHGG_00316 [Chaetomium globosum CBS 148.51]EAQ92081.1 hypothetical protein CHGG_00316 [Chaetomium globosum CBS 148.51]
MNQDDERPNNYAILIGVNDDGMQACVHDVNIMREVLRELPLSIDLRILENSYPKAVSLLEPPPVRPTPDNVKKTLENVTENAMPGGFVYIHFSGHGKEVVLNGTPGGDVELALLQETSDELAMLSGKDVALLSKAMVDKGLTVLLVLDCCFSGATLRGAAGNNANIDDRCNERHCQAPLGYRDATMLPNWMVNPAGFTILAACGPHESAATLGLPSKQATYSAFTYSLYESLIGVNATSKTLSEIYANLCLRFKRMRQLATQTPMLYGNGNIRFFGRPVEANGATPRAAAYWPSGDDGKISLQVGEVHGCCVNDEFVLTPYYDSVAARETSARAVTVGPLSSELAVSGALGTRGNETRWTVTSTTRLALQRFLVQVSEECPKLDEWRDAIRKQTYLNIWIAKDGNESVAFFIEPNTEGGINILDSTKKPVPRLPVMNAQDVEGNLRMVEHLVRFKHNSAEVQTRSPQDPEVETLHENQVVIRIKNYSDSTLYAQLLDLGPRWQVQHIASGVGDAIPPVRYGGGLKERTVTMTLPANYSAGVDPYYDILKVFLSTSPIDLSLWELPDIGGARVPADLKLESHRTDLRAENWAAMNFYIRTVRSTTSGNQIQIPYPRETETYCPPIDLYLNRRLLAFEDRVRISEEARLIRQTPATIAAILRRRRRRGRGRPRREIDDIATAPAEKGSGEWKKRWAQEWAPLESRPEKEELEPGSTGPVPNHKKQLERWMEEAMRREWIGRWESEVARVVARNPGRALEPADATARFDASIMNRHRSRDPAWELSKAKSTLLVQARTGKIGLRGFLFTRRVPEVVTPVCRCGMARETFEHLVLECNGAADKPHPWPDDGAELLEWLDDVEKAAIVVGWVLGLGRLNEFRLAVELENENNEEARGGAEAE